MANILQFLMTMIPYMLMIIPAFLIIRFIILRRKNIIKKINFKHEVVFLLFAAFISGLASLTVLPSSDSGKLLINDIYKLNIIPFHTIIQQFASGDFNMLLINIVGNIVMFIPFGYCPALLWHGFTPANAIMTGFCTSLFIETTQFFIGRSSDIDDLILNTLGAALGYLLYVLSQKINPNYAEKFKLHIFPV
ncbi:MAG TPA: VanZ family protein [Clostridiales bacterium]|nr:VanZ family protein [Eubacteriales bacterium]HBR31409.1 VanZ family protein [Clostridiales bacterium]